MLDELIFFMLMAVGVTYLDDGGPYAGNYGCPAYCAVNHKHLAFKDTLVVSSAMAKNNNKSMLGGFLNYMSGRLGTEIDSLPSGERSLDNLKEMSSFMDTYQNARAQSAAVADMRNEGVSEEIISKVIPQDIAFAAPQAPADNTSVDPLVKEATQNIGIMPSEDYQDMLRIMASRYEQTPAAMEDFMARIAFHESAMTMDPTIVQRGGGPGRGLFQFEKVSKDKQGNYKQAGAMTARNRLERFYADELGMNAPDWLFQKDMNDPSVGFDASKLTKEQQKMLFLANARYHEKAHFRGLTPEKLAEDYWAPYHWAGADADRDARLKSFRSHMEAYDNR